MSHRQAPVRINSFCCLNFDDVDFFDFQLTVEDTKTFMGGGEFGGRKVPP